MAPMQTIVQYVILIVLLVAGFLLITSISQQDWMREEVSMRIPKDMFDTVKNFSSSMLPSENSALKQQVDTIFGIMDDIPSDITLEMKTYSGLQQSCLILTMDGFENPMKLLIPKVEWCFKNDLVQEPTKYGLPNMPELIPYQNLKTQATGLKNAGICMILAILCVALTVTFLLIKLFKWQRESVFATAILILIACICTVAALGLVSSNFSLKKNFNYMKRLSTGSTKNHNDYDGRKRRHLGTGYSDRYSTEKPGYSGRYNSTNSGDSEWEQSSGQSSGDGTDVNDGGIWGEAIGEMAMSILSTLEVKESVGSPLVMAGAGVGCLLLATLLNGVELYLLKKHGGVKTKYHNVELS